MDERTLPRHGGNGVHSESGESSSPLIAAALPELPNEVANPAAYDLVLNGAATADPALRGWLDAALLHSSARAETPRLDRRLTPYFYNTLDEIGGSVHRIFMITEYHGKNPHASSGEISHYVARNEKIALTRLVERLELRHLARLGRGEATSVALHPSTATRVYWEVCHQVLGALALCGRYDLIQTHVLASLPAGSIGARLKDPKTLLQEVSHELFGMLPTYESAGESGPDHSKMYRWRVSLPNGVSAVGSGASKKSAQWTAANEVLRNCPPEIVNAKRQVGSEPRPTKVYVPSPDELPSSHVRTVQRLLRQLHLPPHAEPVLSQALIHSSWPPEHRRGNAVALDYMPLATIGAFALPLPFWFNVAVLLVTEDVHPPRRPSGSLMGLADVTDLAEDLGVESGLALGRGQQSLGVTPSMLAEAAQAILAVHLIFRGIRAFAEQPPEPFRQWLKLRATRAVQGSRGSDFTTPLQELLVTLGIKHSYECAGAGPDHDRQFRSTLTLTSSTRILRVTGGPERSKRQANQRVARATLSLIRAVNKPWTEPLRTALASNQFAREVATFILRQALDIADAASVNRWRAAGLLASPLAVAGDYQTLYTWASDVANFLGLTKAEPKLCLFFAALARGTTDVNTSRFLTDLRHVVETVRMTDLDGAGTFNEGNAYRTLLDLAAICRLAARSEETRDCRSIVGEWVLLSRGATIVVDLPERELILTQRAGALEELLAVISASITEHSVSRVVVNTSMNQKRLCFHLSGDEASGLRESWERRTLLWYLRAELSAWIATDLGGDITVEVPLAADDSFPVSIVRSVGRSLWNSIPAAATLASLLHDLKNQLIACSVAAMTIPIDRTSRLRAQYEMSQHLDRASELSAQVLGIARVMDEVVPAPIDMLSFMRDFVGAVVRELPPGLQIVSPTASTPCTVTTSSTLLRSILDNLVRNAIQAMPEGGTVHLDWVGDPSTNSILIEISDTGRGLPPDVTRAIEEDAPAPSTKIGGSGIGLWSVYRMASRLGVDVTFQSSELGTSWLLTVPSLTLEQAPPADEFDASDMVEATA